MNRFKKHWDIYAYVYIFIFMTLLISATACIGIYENGKASPYPDNIPPLEIRDAINCEWSSELITLPMPEGDTLILVATHYRDRQVYGDMFIMSKAQKSNTKEVWSRFFNQLKVVIDSCQNK